MKHAALSYVQQRTSAELSTKVRDRCHSVAVPPAMTQPLLRVRGVSKSFVGHRVLHDVSLELRPGQVVGLVGENGAGKSTLMKILAGVHQADEGSLELDGAQVSFSHPVQAQQAGLSTVFQEFNLLPERTVAENIYLGREPRRRGLVDTGQMHRDTERLLDDLGVTGLRAGPAGALAERRRAADRRDREGDELRRPDHPDGRADRRAGRARGRAALRHHRAAHRPRGRDPLRLPPAQGDLRALRHDHRAQGRRPGRDQALRRARRRRAGAADGRPLHLLLLPRPAARHRGRASRGSSCAAPATATSTASTSRSAPARSSASPGCRARAAPSCSRRSSASPR